MDVLRFKQANCKNCYKCVRFCPVKSIRVYQGHAQIISSDCILCGNCVSVCPQHAKEDISDVAQIQELIASGQQVVVSVDSSYIAYFDTPGFAGIAEPLKKLGFDARVITPYHRCTRDGGGRLPGQEGAGKARCPAG